MRVFKGFNKDLCCSLGKGLYQYEIGRKEICDGSKTRNTGFHASEYVLECLDWYPLNGNNRYCECIAEGSIDEDGEDIVCCTELTPVEELDRMDIVCWAIGYMVEHPTRKWERTGLNLCVKKDEAEAEKSGIAIARGRNPKAKGKKGSLLGFVRENEKGGVDVARVVYAGGDVCEPDVWYTMTEKGEVVRA